EGLGYCYFKKHRKPLRWTLQNHFGRADVEAETRVDELEEQSPNPEPTKLEDEDEVYDLTWLFLEPEEDLELKPDVWHWVAPPKLYHLPPSTREDVVLAWNQLEALQLHSPSLSELHESDLSSLGSSEHDLPAPTLAQCFAFTDDDNAQKKSLST